MLIPKTFKISKVEYKVEQPLHMARELLRGNFDFAQRTLRVAEYCSGAKLTEAVRNEVFWHETTHAILKDMHHRLHSNEGFVDAFSKRLAEVIATAKF
jgi:hypothetical protein